MGIKIELICPKQVRQRKGGRDYKYCKIEYGKWMKCENAPPWIAVSGKNWILLASLDTFQNPEELELMRMSLMRIRHYMEEFIYGEKAEEIDKCLKKLKESNWKLDF